ncbi:MAG: DNA integrity scanning protein DisA nucleotide-binding domain protein [Candidatus Omnitrophica bacterium]|nr:DNA integrity scanning protein DisA nucleotide-binding domain protein [Candidatus Omnitrophota bacterium]
MALDYWMTAAQIVLTGFLIYRVQRFLRTHRTFELGFLFFIFALLLFATLRTDSPEYLKRWLPITLTAFVSLMALEPEIAGLINQLIQRFNPNSLNRQKNLLGEISRAAGALAATKTGALIAFERNESLLKFGDTGIEINSDVKKELLTTLFTKDTPTHDGGVLIRRGRATHCGAVFPLSERKQMENGLGTRHRAALGLSEKTDAVCLVVSEEEGTISIAKDGDLIYSVPLSQVEKTLRRLLSSRNQPRYYPVHYLRRFAPKLIQPNFVQFSKSSSQRIYELVVAFFWLGVLILWNSYHAIQIESPDQIVSTFLKTPWVFIPHVLFALNLIILLLSRKLIVNGTLNEVKQETRFLFLPLWRRKLLGKNLKAVILKNERAATNLWSLAFLNQKRKLIAIDRATSAKALGESAKKIRDVLRIELLSH